MVRIFDGSSCVIIVTTKEEAKRSIDVVAMRRGGRFREATRCAVSIACISLSPSPPPHPDSVARNPFSEIKGRRAT